MTPINIVIEDSDWEVFGNFPAQDHKSIVQLAKENNIKISTSCLAWACGMCKCQVLQGGEYIDPEKLSKPLGEVVLDKDRNPTSIFACISGIKTESLSQSEHETITLKMRTKI